MHGVELYTPEDVSDWLSEHKSGTQGQLIVLFDQKEDIPWDMDSSRGMTFFKEEKDGSSPTD